ncbi:hypothetical protein KR054_008018 [Drosophila jambulina]|nr:hypothetical protein KR054_008018 [Drosophila jambulina]
MRRRWWPGDDVGPRTLLLLLYLLLQAAAAHRNDTADIRSGSTGDSGTPPRVSASCPQRHLAEILPPANTCPPEVLHLRGAVYILYDVNISEGFNLRRDVYIRMAVFVRRLRQRRKRFRNVRLVLPPWPRLYHWHSQGLQQSGLPWRHFFDLASLRRYAPVLDYDEFLAEQRLFGAPGAPLVHVAHAFRLQHYEVMLEQGIFRDKFERVTENGATCSEESLAGGPLLQQKELQVERFHCVRFQGSAGLLEQLLRAAIAEDTAGPEDADDMRTYVLLSAETVLHDHWGDEHFWRARRSMRFARQLSQVAEEFRQQALSTTELAAGVQRPAMWELERPKRNARGGDYLCAHLRRGDFVRSREATTPSLKSAAQQMKQLMRGLNVSTVFVASDATPYELMELKELFHRFRFVHFTPESNGQRRALKDGGVAVVDQLVCAYARHFVGTYESTFTYRIYEEREILGFSQASTFNTFCKALGGTCSRNAVWPIVWDDYEEDPY